MVKTKQASPLQASRAVMAGLRAADISKEETAAAKNALEEYILSFRSALAEDEDLKSVTKEAQRSKFGAELEKAEDWLYEEGEHASAAEYRCET